MDALEEAGWTPDDLTLLGQFQKKKLLLDVLHDRVVIEQKHTIDLAKPPQLPFKGAEVVKHEGKGVVKLELRSDDNLYIDGKKVVLHLSERQMGDKAVVGHELRLRGRGFAEAGEHRRVGSRLPVRGVPVRGGDARERSDARE